MTKNIRFSESHCPAELQLDPILKLNDLYALLSRDILLEFGGTYIVFVMLEKLSCSLL